MGTLSWSVGRCKEQCGVWWPNIIVGYQLTRTVQNGGPQAIYEILHIEYQIVCYVETYLIHIYHYEQV